MGGGSNQLQYWWQVRWETWNPKIYHRINHLPKHHTNKVWINELEFTAIIVNIFVPLAALENHHMDFDWQTLLHCGGGNKSANCWSTKFFNSNKFARRLTKLLAMAQKNLGIDIIINHVIGILNGFTDVVSRKIPSITLDIKFKKDVSINEAAFACLQVNPSVKQVALRCFQPSLELMSHIKCILLDKSTANLPELCKNNSRQIVPEQTITFNSAATS